MQDFSGSAVPSWAYAALGGLLGAGAVLAWRGSTTMKALTSRGAVLEASLGAQGSDIAAYLAQQGGTVEAELARVARAHADLVARKTAREVLAVKYHLEPEQFRQMASLAQRVR